LLLAILQYCKVFGSKAIDQVAGFVLHGDRNCNLIDRDRDGRKFILAYRLVLRLSALRDGTNLDGRRWGRVRFLVWRCSLWLLLSRRRLRFWCRLRRVLRWRLRWLHG